MPEHLPDAPFVRGRLIAQGFLRQSQHCGSDFFWALLGSVEMRFEFGFSHKHLTSFWAIVKPDACAGISIQIDVGSACTWGDYGRSDRVTIMGVWSEGFSCALGPLS